MENTTGFASLGRFCGVDAVFRPKGKVKNTIAGAVLALALAIAAEKAGERVGLSGQSLPPARGKGQIFRMAERFATEAVEDYVKTTPSDFVGGVSGLALQTSLRI